MRPHVDTPANGTSPGVGRRSLLKAAGATAIASAVAAAGSGRPTRPRTPPGT
ncbi:hypothetical protein SMICM17S_08891 [Streptomyces microflavus]